MNKLFTKIAGLSIGLAMAIGVGVAVGSKEVKSASAAETSYTFTSASWGDSSSSWTSDKAGGQLTSGRGVQVTTSASGAGAHTKTSISNISAIEFTYSTNKSAGAGSISVTIGNNTAVTYSVTKTGGTSDRTTSHTYSTAQSGVVTFTVTCTTNSIYIKSITITTSSSKTIQSLTTDPEDGDSVNLDAQGASSASSSVLYEVVYSDSSKGYDVSSSCNPSSGVTITDDESGELSLSFIENGTFELTIEADNSHSASITFVVAGIPSVEYELFTGSIVAGDYVIMSGDANYTYVLGNSVTSNRIVNGATTPTVSNNKITNPSSDYVWHIAKDGDYWTIQNNANSKYLAATTAKNQAALVTSINDHSRWSASYSTNWVFENLGRASDSDTPANRYLRNNTTNGWASYSSGQGNAPALFKLVSNEPAIEVAVTGSTSLSVGGTATLTATKINGATGTVTWSSDNSHVTLSATAGDSITVTGATDGSTDVTASLTGGSTVTPVVTTFTVTKALVSIAVTTAPTKTTYTEGELFDNTGMVVTATYDDQSTETPSDYTWSPDDALTPSQTSVTISWGGKTTTQAITVNAKVVSGIAVKNLPTKNSYHAGDEFESSGLTITVTYEGGSTADITSGFTIAPDTYTFTSNDETKGSKTFTVTYSGHSTTFNVTVAGITGPIPSGRYYIMSSDKQFGLKAAAASSSPTVTDLNNANGLTAFDFELIADNEYKVTVTIEETVYYLACTTTASSGSNTSIRINTTSTESVWHLNNEDVETEGAYHFYTVPGSVNRYLSCYNSTDWRGYASLSYGDPEIQFIPEGSYAEAIANSLLDDITCDDGVHAPSTTVWSSISSAYSAITIEHEQSLLTAGAAVESSKDIIERALAKYDYIVGKYNKGQGITAYNDFLSRNPSPVGNNRIMLTTVTKNSGTAIAIIAISAISLAAVGGYFLFRKKKEQ